MNRGAMASLFLDNINPRSNTKDYYIRSLRDVVKYHCFFFNLFYFVGLSLLGFLVLRSLPWRTRSPPPDLDVFFMSVSSVTVSSMSTVEMEAFSDAQLAVMTVLMFVGGEVFTSMLGLLFQNYHVDYSSASSHTNDNVVAASNSIELGELTPQQDESAEYNKNNEKSEDGERYNNVGYLGKVVMGYLVAIHVLGSCSILIYVSTMKTASEVLRNKGIRLHTFAVFVTVSSFTNCGFIPTNENMMAFKTNSGLLLLVSLVILAGNVLYPLCLRSLLLLINRVAIIIFKKENRPNSHEDYPKSSSCDHVDRVMEVSGYAHLLSSARCTWLLATAVGMLAIQVVLFSVMEWESEGLKGLNLYQRFVATLFQCINSRHAGESILDLSTISSAVLLLFVLMMYLPPYSSFLPHEATKKDQMVREEEGEEKGGTKSRRSVLGFLVLSPIAYLSIFVIIICITERRKLITDPLNFNVLNIIVEVVSAYGNVGFSTGYGCARQLRAEQDGECRDMWYGFSGKWSTKGKLILITVMFFGRLKNLYLRSYRGAAMASCWRIHS